MWYIGKEWLSLIIKIISGLNLFSLGCLSCLGPQYLGGQGRSVEFEPAWCLGYVCLVEEKERGGGRKEGKKE